MTAKLDVRCRTCRYGVCDSGWMRLFTFSISFAGRGRQPNGKGRYRRPRPSPLIWRATGLCTWADDIVVRRISCSAATGSPTSLHRPPLCRAASDAGEARPRGAGDRAAEHGVLRRECKVQRGDPAATNTDATADAGAQGGYDAVADDLPNGDAGDEAAGVRAQPGEYGVAGECRSTMAGVGGKL